MATPVECLAIGDRRFLDRTSHVSSFGAFAVVRDRASPSAAGLMLWACFVVVQKTEF
jgi:hypothetical protein